MALAFYFCMTDDYLHCKHTYRQVFLGETLNALRDHAHGCQTRTVLCSVWLSFKFAEFYLEQNILWRTQIVLMPLGWGCPIFQTVQKTPKNKTMNEWVNGQTKKTNKWMNTAHPQQSVCEFCWSEADTLYFGCIRTASEEGKSLVYKTFLMNNYN